MFFTSFGCYVQRMFSAEFYMRYVDDMVTIHRDRSMLEAMMPAMERFPGRVLGLTFHPRKRSMQSGCKRLRVSLNSFRGLMVYMVIYRLRQAYSVRQSFFRFRKVIIGRRSPEVPARAERQGAGLSRCGLYG